LFRPSWLLPLRRPCRRRRVRHPTSSTRRTLAPGFWLLIVCSCRWLL
jgi:hypothetical protein